jgi:rRNA maturation RNase YbeY
MRSGIYFFCEDITFRPPPVKSTRSWLSEVARCENRTIGGLNYIFCSDPYLLNINREYLNHDTLTDIITFDNSESRNLIEGDIYISIDRVRENADVFKVTFYRELDRVMVHGLLHLLGYKDKSIHQKRLMRKKESSYLSLRENLEQNRFT